MQTRACRIYFCSSYQKRERCVLNFVLSLTGRQRMLGIISLFLAILLNIINIIVLSTGMAYWIFWWNDIVLIICLPIMYGLCFSLACLSVFKPLNKIEKIAFYANGTFVIYCAIIITKYLDYIEQSVWLFCIAIKRLYMDKINSKTARTVLLLFIFPLVWGLINFCFLFMGDSDFYDLMTVGIMITISAFLMAIIGGIIVFVFYLKTKIKPYQ